LLLSVVAKRTERIAAFGPSRPTREVITELEDRVVDDRVEVVFTVQPAKIELRVAECGIFVGLACVRLLRGGRLS
jgi:hypothetical protein